jgi:hypothetical protein
MGRGGSNLRGGGGGNSNLPVGRSAASPPSAAAAAVDALVGARTHIVAYGDDRLSAGSAGGPISAAALPRSSGSQSMTMRVLAGVCPTGEEGEGGKGAGDASMGESG